MDIENSVKSRKGCFICTLWKTSCCIITSCHKQVKCRDLCWNKVLDTAVIEYFCADKLIHQSNCINFNRWQHILSSFLWQLFVDSMIKLQDMLWGYVCYSFTSFEDVPHIDCKKTIYMKFFAPCCYSTVSLKKSELSCLHVHLSGQSTKAHADICPPITEWLQ